MYNGVKALIEAEISLSGKKEEVLNTKPIKVDNG
jgi:hypothetical protein